MIEESTPDEDAVAEDSGGEEAEAHTNQATAEEAGDNAAKPVVAAWGAA